MGIPDSIFIAGCDLKLIGAGEQPGIAGEPIPVLVFGPIALLLLFVQPVFETRPFGCAQIEAGVKNSQFSFARRDNDFRGAGAKYIFSLLLAIDRNGLNHHRRFQGILLEGGRVSENQSSRCGKPKRSVGGRAGCGL